MTPTTLRCLAGLIWATALTSRSADPTLTPASTAKNEVAAQSATADASSKPEKAAPEGKDKPEPRVRHDTNGDVVVTLDQPTQTVMGLRTMARRARSSES